MRQFSWLLCMAGLMAGMLFAGNTAKAFSEQPFSMAPDRAVFAAGLTNYGSIPGEMTPEGKTDGLPRVRSTFSETEQNQKPYARQVRELIENFGEALDCEAVEETIWYDEPAALPPSPRSRHSDLDGRLRGIGLELELSLAFATSA